MSASRQHTVWLSGRFMSEERARIPASCLTLTFGVGLYETLRLVHGVAPLLELHLARLRGACNRLGLRPKQRAWAEVLAELATRNRIRNGRAKILVGDGFELATCTRLPRDLADERREGIALKSVPLERNLAQFKDTSRLALWAAERSLGAEVLLVSARRQLLETTRANLFVVSERGLETAPATRVLPGVARGLVLELARGMGVTVQLRAPSLRQRARWLEVFVSNALRGIRPVRRIDTLRFAAPSASSLTRRLQRGLDERMGLS